MKKARNLLLILLSIITLTLLIFGVASSLYSQEDLNDSTIDSDNSVSTPSTQGPDEQLKYEKIELTLGVLKEFDLAIGSSACFVMDCIDCYADYEITITASENLKLKINGEEIAGDENKFICKLLKGAFDIEVFGSQVALEKAQIKVDISVQDKDIEIPNGSARMVAIKSDDYNILPLYINCEEMVYVKVYSLDGEKLAEISAPDTFSAWHHSNQYSLALLPGTTYLRLYGSSGKALSLDLIIGEQPLCLAMNEINEAEFDSVIKFYKLELCEYTNVKVTVSQFDAQETQNCYIEVLDSEFNTIYSLAGNNEREIYGVENYCWIGLKKTQSSDSSRFQVEIENIEAPCKWYVDSQPVSNSITLETGKSYELEQVFTDSEECAVSFRVIVANYNNDDIIVLENNLLTIKQIELIDEEPLLIVNGYSSNGQTCSYALYVKISNS